METDVMSAFHNIPAVRFANYASRNLPFVHPQSLPTNDRFCGTGQRALMSEMLWEADIALQSPEEREPQKCYSPCSTK